MTQTATLIDLQAFCAKGDESRYSAPMMNPWNAGGWRYACDGRTAVRVPTTEPDSPPPQHGKYPPVASVFDAPGVDFTACVQPWPDAYAQKKGRCPNCCGSGQAGAELCPECKGEKTIRCSECDHVRDCVYCNGDGYTVFRKEGPCPACDGVGRRMVDSYLQVGEARVNSERARLVAQLPSVRWQPGIPPNRAIPFVFEGGQGLVMPLPPNTHEDDE